MYIVLSYFIEGTLFQYPNILYYWLFDLIGATFYLTATHKENLTLPNISVIVFAFALFISSLFVVQSYEFNVMLIHGAMV